jgi:IS5 family transposase
VELVIGQLQLLEGRDMALVSAEELLAGSIWSAKLQQQLFNLRDEDLEFQVNGRRSFEEFFGLGVMNSIPDAKTVAFFRESLRKAEVIEELFEMLESYLCSQGLQARGGKIIDATIVQFPGNAIPTKRTRKSRCSGQQNCSA